MAININATNAQIVNAVRDEMVMFGARIPETTASNIRDVGDMIVGNAQVANEFLNVLINRIVRVIITSRLFENPLSSFKKGSEQYGDTIEEIFVNMANAHEYNPIIAEREVYKREIPDVGAVYHRMNSQLFYKATVQENSLTRAFQSENGFRTLISAIVDQLYSGANYDEFCSMKEIFAGAKTDIAMVHTDAPTLANANNIVANIKSISNQMEFPKTVFNSVGVKNFTPKNKQVILLRADIDAIVDVGSLASAFNMDKVEFMGRKIVVDDFGDGMDNVYAVLCDEEFMQVVQNLDKFTEQYNAQGLYWNYFWHIWRTYSRSPFANCVAFTTDAITDPTGITLNVTNTTLSAVKNGENIQIISTVAPATAQQSVKYVLENDNGGTYISATGYLHIGEEQTTGLTVQAISVAKESIKSSKITWSKS